jgi:hypothetical protein
MNDAVIDTSVVTFANCDLLARMPGETFDRTLHVLELARDGELHLRYNPKLLTEYHDHVKECRNDVIEIFFTLLDSPGAVLVPRNSLSRQHYQLALRNGWPTHDQHLLAAAIEGDRPHIYVTEQILANCAARVYRTFRIRVICV